MKPIEKIRQLHQEFIREYPWFWKRVWMKHICQYFGITRQSIYKESMKPNSKLNSIDRNKRSNEKFLKFLFNNYKKSWKSDEN